MRVCVYGAGAIGGHIAARLAAGGATVSVVARGAHLAAIQARGLVVHAGTAVLESRPRAAADPADLGPQDAVVVTVKQPSLPDVAAGIAPLLGPETSVAFVMNGVPWWYFDRLGGRLDGLRLPALDPGDALRHAVGIGRTLGGVVYSAATVTAPGVVRVEAADGRVILGEPDGSLSPRVQALAAAIAAGGMGGQAVADIRQAVWAKLLGNLMTGLVCVLARSDMRDALAHPPIRDAAVRCGEEVMAMAAAHGFDLGGAVAARVERSMTMAHKPSILQDLELGRPMEVEALWRAPLRLAREAGVATPTLDVLVALCCQAAEAAGLWRPEEG